MNRLGKLSRTSSLSCPGFWDSQTGLPSPIPQISVSPRQAPPDVLAQHPVLCQCPLSVQVVGSPESAGAPGGQRLRRAGQ